MAFNRSNYPVDWPEISRRIRFVRAGGRCECSGECGLHSDHPGPRRCTERDGQPAQWAKGKVMLTVAHLNSRGGPCQCEPRCGREDHLKAMCQRCHIRYDIERHVRNARATRRGRKAMRELFPG